MDGNWIGFDFPDGLIIDKLIIDYPIDLRWAKFNELSLKQVKFQKKINLGNSHFKKKINLIQTEFFSSTIISNCRFDDDLRVHATFNGKTHFTHGDFIGRVSFGGSFNGKTSFTNSIFHDSVDFRGGRDITIFAGSVAKKDRDRNHVKIRRLFNKPIQMQDVDFRHPKRVKFVGVDLSWVSLLGTNINGVHLYDTDWYQPKLKRRGLYDEVYALSSRNKNERKYMIPRIEALYRNVRVALEENKDYSVATDFYIGEMENRRKKKGFLRGEIFSIEVLYRTLSLYGTSPLQAIGVFLWILCLHTLITLSLTSNISGKVALFNVEYPHLMKSYIEIIFSYFTNSLNVLTLKRFGPFINNGIWQSIADTVFRILGPLQIALIAMAFRTRIKRH